MVVVPTSKCKLRLLKLERVRDYLLMEQEFIQNQELRKPREETNAVRYLYFTSMCCSRMKIFQLYSQTELADLETIRGMPMEVGTYEEYIDDQHAVVTNSSNFEEYVTVCSFVDRDLLVLGCTVLLHNKVRTKLIKLFYG